MSALEYIKLAFEVGAAVIRLAKDGKKVVRIEDVLPSQYRDRMRLRELEEAAKKHYED